MGVVGRGVQRLQPVEQQRIRPRRGAIARDPLDPDVGGGARDPASRPHRRSRSRRWPWRRPAWIRPWRRCPGCRSRRPGRGDGRHRPPGWSGRAGRAPRSPGCARRARAKRPAGLSPCSTKSISIRPGRLVDIADGVVAARVGTVVLRQHQHQVLARPPGLGGQIAGGEAHPPHARRHLFGADHRQVPGLHRRTAHRPAEPRKEAGAVRAFVQIGHSVILQIYRNLRYI